VSGRMVKFAPSSSAALEPAKAGDKEVLPLSPPHIHVSIRTKSINPINLASDPNEADEVEQV